jgi:hypothetical protein
VTFWPGEKLRRVAKHFSTDLRASSAGG